MSSNEDSKRNYDQFLPIDEIREMFKDDPELFQCVSDTGEMNFFGKGPCGVLFENEIEDNEKIVLIEVNDLNKLLQTRQQLIKYLKNKKNYLCVLDNFNFFDIDINDDDHDGRKLKDLTGYEYESVYPEITINKEKVGDVKADKFLRLKMFFFSDLLRILQFSVNNEHTLFLNLDKTYYPIPNLELKADQFPDIFDNRQFQFPNLDALRLEDYYPLGDKPASSLFFQNKLNLESLRHLDIIAESSEFKNADLPNLKTFSFTLTQKFKDPILKFKNLTVPKLEVLNLAINSLVDVEFEANSIDLENLQLLRIEGRKDALFGPYSSTLEKSFIETILSLTGTLPKLELFSQTPAITSLFYKGIDKVETLKFDFLNLMGNYNNLNKVPQNYPLILNNLKDLTIRFKPDDYIPFKYISAPNLTRLNLSLNKGLYTPVFEHIPSAFPNLRELYINLELKFKGTAVGKINLDGITGKSLLTFDKLEYLQIGNELGENGLFDSTGFFKNEVHFPNLKVVKWFDGVSESGTSPKTFKLSAPLLEEFQVISTNSQNNNIKVDIETGHPSKITIKYDADQAYT